MDLQELFLGERGGNTDVFSHHPGDLLVEPTLTFVGVQTLTLVRVEHNIFVIIYISFIRENDHPNSDDHDWLITIRKSTAQAEWFSDLVVSVRAARLGSQRLFCSSLCLFLSFASCESQGSTRVNWWPWNLVFSQKPLKGMFLLGSKNGRKQTMLSEEWIQI